MQASEEPESLKQARLKSNFQTSMMAFGDYLPTNSELDRLIFKLLTFVKATMLVFINDGAIQNSPEAQFACRHGLSPGQLRYFFDSYPKISEERRRKYAFIDDLRGIFKKYAIDEDEKTFNKFRGELPTGKLNKHLIRLKTRKVIQQEGVYYFPAGEALIKNSLPYYYKRMMRRVPVDSMISSDRADAYALLIYPDRKIPKSKTGRKKYHLDLDSSEEARKKSRKTTEEDDHSKFEAEVFKLLATFENNLRRIYEEYYSERLDKLLTNMETSPSVEDRDKFWTEYTGLSTSTKPIIILAPFQQPSWPSHISTTRKGRRRRKTKLG